MAQAGFGLIEISPLVGTPMAGYLNARYVSGVHDPLFARALALTDGQTSALVISFDLIGLADADVAAIRKAVAERVPVDEQRIILFCTHTHTGPALVDSFETPRGDEYARALPEKAARAAETAWHDLAEAEVSFAQKEVPGVAFQRRYFMKDGTVRTNPGKMNPDIVGPQRHIRTPITLIGFERDKTRLPIVVASFPCHADVVGGTEASADYPGRVCDHITHEFPGHPETLFLRAPAGDINHLNVFDASPQSGYEYSKYMARAITEQAVQAWRERVPAPGPLATACVAITLERRSVEQGELASARSVFAQSKMLSPLPVDAVWAREKLLLAEMPEQFRIEMNGIRIGGVRILGMPGELFSELGDAILARSPTANTVVADCCGGKLGYLPTREAYSQNGYEERPARSSPCAPGSGEAVVEAALSLAAELA